MAAELNEGACLGMTVMDVTPLGPAAVLSTISRAVKPPPNAVAPRYCCLAFGEESVTPVWIALDRDVLYVDRDGDFDFEEAEEKIPAALTTDRFEATFLVGDLAIPGVEPAGLRVRRGVEKRGGETISIDVRIRKMGAPSEESDGRYLCYAMSHEAHGNMAFCQSIESASILHFGGGWQLQLHQNGPVKRGREFEATATLDALGLGPGSRVSVRVQNAVPKSAEPVVQFLNGGPAVRLRHRC